MAVSAILLSLGISGAAVATPGQILYVQGKVAVVREAPRADAPQVLRLLQGHKLMEYERRGSWVNVGIFETLGTEGWIFGSLVGPRPPGEDAAKDSVAQTAPAAEEAPVDGGRPADRVEFLLEVAGSPAIAFSGHCRLVDGSGRIQAERIGGLVPKHFALGASAVSCRVQKMDSLGRLKVRILKAGRRIAAAETAAPFNFVRVRSKGPWGAARGYRGAVPLFSLRSEDPSRLIPPLSGTSVPPLSGRSVPPLSGRSVPPLSGRSVPPLSGRSVPPLSGTSVPLLSPAP